MTNYVWLAARIAGFIITLGCSNAELSGQPFALEDLDINAEHVFPDGEHLRGTEMNAKITAKFNPDRIDQFYDEATPYYITDTVATSAAGSVYCIVRFDPNEIVGWLVIYDGQMQVKNTLEVYYENAEGNYYLSSTIRDGIVTCTGDNITPEENPVSKYRLLDDLQWEMFYTGK